MNILQKIQKFFREANRPQIPFYDLTVKCKRCGEVIHARVNLYNDLSVEYGEDDKTNTYICRKELMGEGHCFQRVEVKLVFDAKRNLIEKEITGGEFIE